MKRSKRIICLTAVLALVCAATVALSGYQEKQEQIKNSDAIILQIPQESVTALSWSYSSGDGLAFTKTEEGWQYDEDTTVPVSLTRIGEILTPFENYGVTFIIENVDDYSQYGLDEPECTLSLTTADKEYTIKMGDFSKMDEQRYIDIGDGNVYLVKTDPMEYVDSALSSMIQHDDTPGFEQVESIVFKGNESYTITREENSANTYNTDEDIYFLEKDGKTVPMDTSKVKTLLSTITGLNLSDYVTYNATQDVLESLGLEEPTQTITVHYTYTDDAEQTQQATCIIHISEDPEERAAYDEAVAAGNSTSSVAKYVRVGDSSIVYKLGDANYAILSAVSYNDLRHDEIFWADFGIVKELNVTLEGQTHTLSYRCVDESAKEPEYSWYYGEEPISISAVKTALTSLSAEEFTAEVPEGKEEIRLTILLDNENFPSVELILYRCDGSTCLAVVDGETVALVSRSTVMELVEAVQAIVLA